jgi:hypothetical protein
MMVEGGDGVTTSEGDEHTRAARGRGKRVAAARTSLINADIWMHEEKTLRCW